MDALITLAIGATAATLAVGAAATFVVIRLRRHLLKTLSAQLTQQVSLTRRLTDIIIQLQQNQSKHDEQLQKIAEFSLGLKKQVAVIASRQQEDETPPAPKKEKQTYLN